MLEESLLLKEVLPNILYFQCVGEQSYNHTMRRFNKMYAELQARAIWNVLVEGSTEDRLSLIESYNAIKAIKKKLGMDFFKVRVAFLDQRSTGFEHNAFAENVATNRGLCLRFFQCKEEALNWLQKLA